MDLIKNQLQVQENLHPTIDKNLWHKISNINDIKNEHSLAVIFTLYFNNIVKGSSVHTEQAKRYDFNFFFNYFINIFGCDDIDLWTPSVSRDFQKYLSDEKKLKGSSVNRITATLRHAAKWIERYRPFIAGYPFENVKRVREDDPAWRGITKKQMSLLKAAVDIRLKICTKQNQCPLLEAAVFYTLICTGLRKSELMRLNVKQYQADGLCYVKRKGDKVTHVVPLTKEARRHIDNYLASRSNLMPDDPLFCSKFNNRLSGTDVDNIILRISNQAQAQLPENERFKLSPHMFRHHFGKSVADTQGINAAQELLGNVSWKNVFRYTRPSAEEMAELVQKVFD